MIKCKYQRTLASFQTSRDDKSWKTWFRHHRSKKHNSFSDIYSIYILQRMWMALQSNHLHTFILLITLCCEQKYKGTVLLNVCIHKHSYSSNVSRAPSRKRFFFFISCIKYTCAIYALYKHKLISFGMNICITCVCVIV